jgi:hypothetical protein
MPTVADYEDAVRRIAEADVPDDATTQAEVRQALSGSNAPQVTREVADGVADSLVTEERVLDAIEASGELPSEAELGAITDVADDYDLDDRVEAVEDAVRERVATREDVESAVRERQEQAATSGRPTFREDVEGAVDSVGERKEIVGESPDEIVSEQSREIGAPRRSAFERAKAQAVATGDQVTPSEVVDGTTAKTPVSVIRNEAGEAVAATGGPSDETGRRVAEAIGAEYMSTEEVTADMRTEGRGDRVSLTLRGQRIGEVDVE